MPETELVLVELGFRVLLRMQWVPRDLGWFRGLWR